VRSPDLFVCNRPTTQVADVPKSNHARDRLPPPHEDAPEGPLGSQLPPTSSGCGSEHSSCIHRKEALCLSEYSQSDS
jgi:hypothetical protein